MIMCLSECNLFSFPRMIGYIFACAGLLYACCALYLPAVGSGSSFGCSAPWQSFRLRDDWLRQDGWDFNNMGGALVDVGGALTFN